MVGVEGMRKPSSGRGWLVWGLVLMVLGIICIVIFLVGASTPTAGDAQGSSIWQSLSVILGAVLFGVGLASVITGVIKRGKFAKG